MKYLRFDLTIAAVVCIIIVMSVSIAALNLSAADLNPKTQEGLLKAAVEVAIQRIDEGHVEIARQVLVDVLEDTK